MQIKGLGGLGMFVYGVRVIGLEFWNKSEYDFYHKIIRAYFIINTENKILI